MALAGASRKILAGAPSIPPNQTTNNSPQQPRPRATYFSIPQPPTYLQGSDAMNNSPINSSDDFTRVPIQLLYNPPQKGDFPSQSFNNWRNGLKNVLSSVESSSKRHERNPIVLFLNDKYVCTYDMVSHEFNYR